MTRTAYRTQRQTAARPWTPEGWILVPAAPTQKWIDDMRSRTSYPQVKLAIEMVLATAPKYGED